MNTTSGRRAIVVAGMHRSGTSAFVRCVNLLGAGIGEKLIPANWGNERGFWEDEEVVAADDALLAAAGRTWHDVRSMPAGWESSPAITEPAARIARIVADETARCPLWVVKDPRLSRLVPAWDEAFASSGVEPHFLVALRHPAEVASSQERRDGFPAGKSHLLWLRHLLEVERATRGRRRVFCLYDDLLRDWRGTLANAGAVLGLDWPVSIEVAATQIDAFLGRDLRHFSLEDERAWQEGAAAPPVVEAWRAFRAVAGTPGADPATRECLDRVARTVEASERIFAPVVDDLYRELGEAREAVDTEHAGWEREIERARAIEEWGREVDRQLGSVRENLASELQRRATAEGQARIEHEARLRTEAAFREESERRVRTAAELIEEQGRRRATESELAGERTRRAGAENRLARLSTEVEALRGRRFVRMRDRMARPGDLSGQVAPVFRQMLDDSRLFAGDLRGFGLVPGESLRGSGPRTWALRVDRPGLAAVSIAVAVDAQPSGGTLEIALLSPAGAILRRAEVAASALDESVPLRFDFEPLIAPPGPLRLRVGAHGVNVPVRVFEWRRSDLGGVARRSRAFCALEFDAVGVFPMAADRVEGAQERRGDHRGES